MAGSSHNDEGYWPGFVDALTNIVIAMIFVVLVLAISMSFSAQLFGKKLAERMLAQKLAEIEAKKTEYIATAAVRPPDVVAIPAKEDKPTVPAIPVSQGMPESDSITHALITVEGLPVDKVAGVNTPRPAQNGIELRFTATAVLLDEAAATALKGAIQSELSTGAKVTRVELLASGPQMDLSEQQRAAYLRLMAVRNELLDAGIKADLIDVRIDTKPGYDKSKVMVTFIREKSSSSREKP